MTGYFTAAPRALTSTDIEAARALVVAALGVTPYVDRVLELLAMAEREDPESRALVIERDGTIAGLTVFGPVAGAQGVWRLSSLLLAPNVEGRDVGRALVTAVVDFVARSGARLLTAELPADPAIGQTLSLLRANGFTQEGRIPDFFRPGVSLLFLRREV